MYMKTSKKYIILILAVIVVVGGFMICSGRGEHGGENLLGGDIDKDGCKGSAGYTFVKSVGACAREWEISDKDERRAVQIAVEYVGFEKGLTILDVETLVCSGCFEVTLDRNVVSLQDWEVSSVDEL